MTGLARRQAFTKMKIHNTVITEAQIEVCIARMKASPFEAYQIAAVAMASGVPARASHHFIAGHFADRLIQKLRREGKIKVGAPYPTWTWVNQ